MSNGNKLAAVLGVSALLAAIWFAPIEETLALAVAIIGAGAALLGLGACRDERERGNVLRLFVAAFCARAVFTFALYRLELTHGGGLGGGDEGMWWWMFVRSRTWDAPHEYPHSVEEVLRGLSAKQNLGYLYLGGLFFHATNLPSQMGLSFLNVLAGALTPVLIYAGARTFYSERAALFVGYIACFAPSYLFWSAMSQKEAFVIAGVAFTLYAVLRLLREPNALNVALVVLALLSVAIFRFYVAQIFIASLLLSLLVWRAKRPGVTMLLLTIVGGALFFVLSATRLVSFDLAGAFQARLQEAQSFGNAMSGNAQAGVAYGNRSGVVLTYDVTTPAGLAQTLLVGGAYVLLSPFPWQMSGRQFAVLPEALAWWSLLLWGVAPGIWHAWKTQRRVLLVALAFLLPLILVYSIGFGNVFLTYRMRAQMLPFYFLLVASGYDWHLKRRQQSVVPADPQRQAIERLREVVGSRVATARTSTVSRSR